MYHLCSAQRTRVLDDERDFFAVDVSSWTTPEEKAALVKKEEALMERKFASRRNRVVSLDIAGKRVVEDRSEIGAVCVCVCVCVCV